VAFAALIEANVHGMDFIEKLRGAFHKEIGQSRCRASVDQSGAALFFEFLGVAELLDLEGIACEVRAEVEVMCAQTQSGTQYDFVEDGGRSIDDEIRAFCRAHDAAEVARIHFGYGNNGFFAEKAMSPSGIPVAAPHQVASALQ